MKLNNKSTLLRHPQDKFNERGLNGYYPEGTTFDKMGEVKRLRGITNLLDEISPFKKGTISDQTIYWLEKLIKFTELEVSKEDILEKTENSVVNKLIESTSQQDKLDNMKKLRVILDKTNDFFDERLNEASFYGVVGEKVCEMILLKKPVDVGDKIEVEYSFKDVEVEVTQRFYDAGKAMAEQILEIPNLIITEESFQQTLYDPELWIMGKLDFIAEDTDGDVTVVDFKLGSEVKNKKRKKAKYQLFGYKKMVETTPGKKVKNLFIISAHEEIVDGEVKLINKKIDLLRGFNQEKEYKVLEDLKNIFTMKSRNKMHDNPKWNDK